MKKVLLLTALVFTAYVSNAQTALRDIKKVQRTVVNIDRNATMKRAETIGKKKAPLKTAATGIYYKRPAGTMYHTWDKEGRGYAMDMLNITPWAKVSFEDASNVDSKAVWHLNVFNTAGKNTYTLDVSDLAEGNTLTWDQEPGYHYPVPTVVHGLDSFALSEVAYDSETDYGNYYWTNGRGSTDGKYFYTRMETDSIDAHSFVSDHTGGTGWRGLFYNGTGEDRNTYVFGTGTYTETDTETNDETVYNFRGVMQYFEKPITPLYVEDAFLRGWSFAATPMAAGTALTMHINKAEFDETNGLWVPGDEIATLKCNADTEGDLVVDASSFSTYGYCDVTATFF